MQGALILEGIREVEVDFIMAALDSSVKCITNFAESSTGERALDNAFALFKKCKSSANVSVQVTDKIQTLMQRNTIPSKPTMFFSHTHALCMSCSLPYTTHVDSEGDMPKCTQSNMDTHSSVTHIRYFFVFMCIDRGLSLKG